MIAEVPTNRNRLLDRFYVSLLSKKVKEKSEFVIVLMAIVGFGVHLLLIVAVHLDFIRPVDHSKLLDSPIAAIYTPFSFILIYEVYLLVYYLPKSTYNYVGKQYEIITLIVIRRLYKDLSKLEFTNDWFKVRDDIQFTYDLVATVLLFALILIFYRLRQKQGEHAETQSHSADTKRFITLKKLIATCLVPIFVGLSVYSLSHWVYENFFSIGQMVDSMKDVNKIFFDEFFTVLILTDVLLLLISFLYTDRFNKVIRNSGFIISTILIRLSFGIDGLLNTILIVVAVLFGVAVLAIHNQFEKLPESTKADLS
jgi:hypothetical protein